MKEALWVRVGNYLVDASVFNEFILDKEKAQIIANGLNLSKTIGFKDNETAEDSFNFLSTYLCHLLEDKPNVATDSNR